MNIRVAKLKLGWDSTSWIKPINTPHLSRFKTIENIKITWISEDVGRVTLEVDVNYALWNGEYYFLRKDTPLDEEKKFYQYTLIKDYWMTLKEKNISVKGHLIKTTDERVLWDNLPHTVLLTTDLSGIKRLNTTQKTVQAADLMKQVKIITKNLREDQWYTYLPTYKEYAKFIKGIEDNITLQNVTNTQKVILSTFKFKKDKNWKRVLIEIINQWLIENREKLVIASNNTWTSIGNPLKERIKDHRLKYDSNDQTYKTIKVKDATAIGGSSVDASSIEEINIDGLEDIHWIDNTTGFEKEPNRLTVKMFGNVERYGYPITPILLRPKIYSSPDNNSGDLRREFKVPWIYSQTIRWKRIVQGYELYKYTHEEKANYLYDWADGLNKGGDVKEVANAQNMIMRETGILIYKFSTWYAHIDALVKDFYVRKDSLDYIEVVNGYRCSSTRDVTLSFNKSLSGDPETKISWDYIIKNSPSKVISLLIWYDSNYLRGVIRDHTSSLMYSCWNIPGNRSQTKTAVGWDDIRGVLDTFHSQRLKIELRMTNIKINRLVKYDMIINNLTHDFYRIRESINNNKISDRTLNIYSEKIDLNNQIAYITEPNDINLGGDANIKQKGFGVRFVKQYQVKAPSISRLEGNCIESVDVREIPITTLTKLLKKRQSTQTTLESDQKIRKWLDEVRREKESSYGGMYAQKTFIVKEWKGGTLNAQYRAIDLVNVRGWESLASHEINERLWPQKNGHFIYPSEIYLYSTGFFGLDKKTIVRFDSSAFELQGNWIKSINNLFDVNDTRCENFFNNTDAVNYLKACSGPQAKSHFESHIRNQLGYSTTAIGHSGHLDKLIYEAYQELAEVNTIEKNSEYYIQWWDASENAVSIFDLVGTNYYAIVKGGNTITIELLLKNNSGLKKQTNTDISFQANEKNSNLIYNINQVNTLFVYGKTFPLRTKIDFREDTIIKFKKCNVKKYEPTRPSAFDYYVLEFQSDQELWETKIEVIKKAEDVSSFDPYQYETLVLRYQEAEAKRYETKLIAEESKRQMVVDLENKKEDLAFETKWGTAQTVLVGAARLFQMGRGLGVKMSGLREQMQGAQESAKDAAGSRRTPLEVTALAGGTSIAGAYMATQAAVGLANNIIDKVNMHRTANRAIQQQEQNIANNTLIREFQVDEAEKYAMLREQNEILRLSSTVRHADITETSQLEAYLKEIEATQIHLIVNYPEEIQMEALKRYYDRYGYDISLNNYEWNIGEPTVNGDEKYIIQFSDIEKVEGTENEVEILYMKMALTNGIKIINMDGLDDTGEPLEEFSVVDVIEVERAALAHCKADMLEQAEKMKDLEAGKVLIVSERDKLQAELERIKLEIEEAKAEKTRIETQLEEVTRERDVNANTVASLQQAAQKSSELIQQLETKQAEMTKTNSDLTEALAAEQRKITALTEHNKTILREKNLCQTDLANQTENARGWQQQFTEMRQQFFDEQTKYNNKLAELATCEAKKAGNPEESAVYLECKEQLSNANNLAEAQRNRLNSLAKKKMWAENCSY